MGVRILYDRQNEMACLYSSSTDTAFGPVFTDGEAPLYKDADERAEAFCRWLDSEDCDWTRYDSLVTRAHRDPRHLTSAGLESAYSDWLSQEDAQYAREEAAEAAKYAELDS